MIRTATATPEDNNGGAVDMQNIRDGRQGRQQRQWRKRMVADMQEKRDVYGRGGDVGRQQMRCWTTEMAKWVVTE